MIGFVIDRGMTRTMFFLIYWIQGERTQSLDQLNKYILVFKTVGIETTHSLYS